MIKELEDILVNIEKKNPAAAEWLKLYITYCSLIDDEADESKSLVRLSRLTEYASRVFNHNYWLTYRSSLYITERLMHNSYFDSLQVKGIYAKFLSQCGSQMVFAVLLIEFGEAAVRDCSLKLRKAVYDKHIED